MKVAKKIRGIVILVIVTIVLSGCATTSNQVRPDFTLRSETEKILLMPMDIQLSTLTAGGMLEPNAEWTEQATIYVTESIDEKFADNNIEILNHHDVAEEVANATRQPALTQLVKLHEAVGVSILLHKYVPILYLPNKEGKFDWTLGRGTQLLKDEFGTDYALFVYLRDSYCSAGRVAFIAIAAVVGVGVPGGQQTGFASLVDLNTGEIVWFNRLVRGVGDLRNKEAASSSVDILLADFPLS